MPPTVFHYQKREQKCPFIAYLVILFSLSSSKDRVRKPRKRAVENKEGKINNTGKIYHEIFMLISTPYLKSGK